MSVIGWYSVVACLHFGLDSGPVCLYVIFNVGLFVELGTCLYSLGTVHCTYALDK